MLISIPQTTKFPRLIRQVKPLTTVLPVATADYTVVVFVLVTVVVFVLVVLLIKVEIGFFDSILWAMQVFGNM